MKPRILIILPVHNRIKVTAEFITQLKAQTYRNFHLIVVNDGSTDGTIELIRREQPGAIILQGDGNLWWAGSLQKGYEWVREHSLNRDDLVLTINDDTKFDSRFLENAVHVLQNRRRTLLCAQCFGLNSGALIDSGVTWDWGSGGMRLAEHDGEINCFSTRGLFLRAGEFIDLGGFHPKLVPHYFSDYEFTIRAYHRGFAMITDPTVTVSTDERPAGIAEYDQSSLRKFFRQYFSKKNYRHPVYTFFFIYFAFPGWRWKLRQWRKLAGEIRRSMFCSKLWLSGLLGRYAG